MCGIAGIYGREPEESFERNLQQMLDTMAHRGPDGEGIYVDSSRRCGLAHKRLAIIDPESGQQPMSNEDQSIYVTFNGCIYNYQDLARELRACGHVFRTHSDTEVIVHAYEQWGVECVKRFNGMFAFAVCDTNRDVLFCARDRVGIKPFYYTLKDGGFAFASEIKALLAGGHAGRQPSDDGLRQYLTFQFCLHDMTMFKDVKKLSPGHTLLIKGGGKPVISKYWDIEFDIDEEHDADWFVDKVIWLFEDAVRLRLRADVPLGAHLSGGLDSSAVVGLARMLLGEAPIKTFTGAFREGNAYDETQYAKMVSQEANTEYLETYLTSGDFADSIEKIIYHMDEPAAGPGVFPQYWVSKLASENVKVVLGGQGGDEIFIGYARYLVAYLEECLKGAIENTAHRANYVATLETIVPSLPTLENYTPMLRSFWSDGLFDDPARRYFALMNRFAGAKRLLADDFAATIDSEKTFAEFESIFKSPGAAAKINRILCFDVKTHLQSLLHVEDRTSMAWSLESRVPLLDHRLLELVASVPPAIKFKNGQLKYLFRHAIKNIVPAKIMNRTDKMGFPVPLNHWLKTDLSDFVADMLGSQACRERGIFDRDVLDAAISSSQPFNRALWGALCIEIWHGQFMDAA